MPAYSNRFDTRCSSPTQAYSQGVKVVDLILGINEMIVCLSVTRRKTAPETDSNPIWRASIPGSVATAVPLLGVGVERDPGTAGRPLRP